MRSSVVVVSYKPGSWLRPCLESAVAQADQVVVVDNGSDGEEASLIARQLGAEVIRRPVNVGFAPAVNLALRRCSGDVVGLLNDDAEAGPDWLDAAADVLSDPSVAAVTPKVVLSGAWAEWVVPERPGGGPRRIRSVLVGGEEVVGRLVGPGLAPVHLGLDPRADDDGRAVIAGRPLYIPVAIPVGIPAGGQGVEVVIDGCHERVGPLTRLLNHAGSFLLRHGIAAEHGYGAPDDGRFDRRRDCFGFSGTAPVLSARALRELGGFPAVFFAYNEDTDWCLRARAAGWRVLYDPAATVVHRMSATSGGVANARVRFLSERNALLCLLRHAPRDVIDECVVPRLRIGPRDEVRASVLRHLPWALATRMRMARRRVVGPAQLWQEWVGRDATWDDSPVRGGRS